MAAAQFSVAALNHLLSQNSWAALRLIRFAGKTACIEIAPFSFAYVIREDGLLAPATSEALPDVRCVIPPALLPRIALRDEKALGEIHSEGDASLLSEIFFLAKNLHWHLAEELSPYIGDVAAERSEQALHASGQQLRNMALNFSQGVAEYVTEEQPLVAASAAIHDFVQQVDILRDNLARLEQRIKRLTEPVK
jgi:ubiquinone biosynthesis protein UbiJ